jgi:hypothetical protein
MRHASSPREAPDAPHMNEPDGRGGAPVMMRLKIDEWATLGR